MNLFRMIWKARRSALHICRTIILGGVVTAGAFFISAYILPWVYEAVEHFHGMPLFYEGVLRLEILSSFALALIVWIVWLLLNNKPFVTWFWWCTAALAFLCFVPVAFFDVEHRLMEEYSWIRYPTAGWLFLAALGAAALAKRRHYAWAALSFGFGFAAFDELAQIHEKTGEGLNALFNINFGGDLVTIIYALGAVIVGAIVFIRLIAGLRFRFWFAQIFIAACATFALATVFDISDFWILKQIQHYTALVSGSAWYVFGDAWATIWAPRNFLNGVEEVLEMVAGSFFAAAMLIVLIDARLSSIASSNFSTKKIKIAAFLTVVVLVEFIWLFVHSAGADFPTAPIITEAWCSARPTRILSRSDGLFHADDSTYNSRWGFLVANEGGSNVVQWKNGHARALPDPRRIIKDVDSVAANDSGVYVADGAQGIIARFDEKNNWIVLFSRADGLRQPEGLVFVGNIIYVIDEGAGSLMRLRRGEKISEWRPAHPLWQAPEGIAYDAKTRRLIVVDDITGGVFAVEYGKKIKLLAQVSRGEDVAVGADGTIYVADNGWGRVIAVRPDQTIANLIQFRRAYRDLVGVALDERNNVFVTISDGYASGSIMPSAAYLILR